jgi:uncharacterized protein (DUF342 family)
MAQIETPSGESLVEETAQTIESLESTPAPVVEQTPAPAPADTTAAEDVSAGEESWRMNVITDPAISARCDELDRQRLSKIEVKQQLMALIRRGEKARKITPKEKKSINRKLTDTDVKLKNELELTRMKIESLEEHIIRQGCPGIRL